MPLSFCVDSEGTGWSVPHPAWTRLPSLPKKISLMPEFTSPIEFWIFPPKSCLTCQSKDCAWFTVLSDLWELWYRWSSSDLLWWHQARTPTTSTLWVFPSVCSCSCQTREPLVTVFPRYDWNLSIKSWWHLLNEFKFSSEKRSLLQQNNGEVILE